MGALHIFLVCMQMGKGVLNFKMLRLFLFLGLIYIPSKTYAGYPSCPSFMVGFGYGGTDEYVGELNYRQCIEHCTKLKLYDGEINGVTIPRLSNTGCFCERNMKKIGRSSKYMTCYLRDVVTVSLHLTISEDTHPTTSSVSLPRASCVVVRLKDPHSGRTTHKEVKKFWRTTTVATSSPYVVKLSVNRGSVHVGHVVEGVVKLKCPAAWWKSKPQNGDLVPSSERVVVEKNEGGGFCVELELKRYS